MQPTDRPIRATRAAKAAAVLLGLAGIVWSLSVIPWPRSALPARTGATLANVKAWGYQLQRFEARTIPPEIDMLVVDYSRDGTVGRELQRRDVEDLQRRDGRPPRIVLAYLSVGEAESYRFYWRRHWSILKPRWLGAENAAWKGNFLVRFWEPSWQQILMADQVSMLSRLLDIGNMPQSTYLDRILEAGFDGVYMDRVDAFYDWSKQRPATEHDMVVLVASLSKYAKTRRPGFLVVAQNGEELLAHDSYRRAIDGIAKEELMFGVDGPNRRNATGDFLKSMQLLHKAKSDGMSVFVVEYITDAEQRREASARMSDVGFPLLFANKELNLPPEIAGKAPAAVAN